MPADVEDIVPFLFSLSPTLHTLTLEFKHELSVAAQDWNFLLPFLALISDPPGHPLDPTICRLINRDGDAEELMRHLRTCARLRSLEALDLSNILYNQHHSSIAALSRLPSLHTLNVGLRVYDCSTIPFLTLAGFASLRHLSLLAQPLSWFSEILTISGLRASRLRSINLECYCRTADDNRVPISISQFQHHVSLIRAALPDAPEEITLWLVYDTRAEPCLPLSTLFAPFLSLHQLKAFYVSFSRYVPHVLDDDMHAPAVAWPRLEVLSVQAREMRTTRFSAARPRPPTVAGLIELARGSPLLRRVTLPALDVSALPEMGTLPHEGHKGVRFLDMSALVKDEGVAVEDVAKILDWLFPYHGEYSRIGKGTPEAHSWHKVQDVLQELQAARKGVRRE